MNPRKHSPDNIVEMTMISVAYDAHVAKGVCRCGYRPIDDSRLINQPARAINILTSTNVITMSACLGDRGNE
jgi:hypothetical protein